MNAAQARAALEGLTVRAVKPGLTRTRWLLARLGRPDRACPAVHVTGTNGKGSTAAALSAILHEAGVPALLYTSPHLGEARERFRIAESPPAQAAWNAAVTELAPALMERKRLGDPATTFEAWTVLAALLAARSGVRVALLEAGMGGRLDATRAWAASLGTVLTSVSLDHTRELGGTEASIFEEKAALARAGRPWIAGVVQPDLQARAAALAEQRGCPLDLPGRTFRVSAWRRIPQGVRFNLVVRNRRLGPFFFSLRGKHQAGNGALAVVAAQRLAEAGLPVTEAHIRAGLARTAWPGRLEIVRRSPTVILDGAHNPAASRALAGEIRAFGARAQMVLGIMADKDVEGICRMLAPVADTFWTVKPPDPRGLPARDLARICGRLHGSVEACPSWRRALAGSLSAAGRRGLVVVAGSIYNIEKSRGILRDLAGAKEVRKGGRPALTPRAADAMLPCRGTV